MDTGYEVPIDQQFETDEVMFIPLTIDDMEVEDTSYFFSGTKLLLLAVGIMPYFSIFFMLDYFGTISIFLITTVIYFLVFSFYARFLVFEEGKQRDAMKDLENNKVSGMSYFWEWDKVGTSRRDDGQAYIQSDGVSLRRAYIIRVDSGSDVGVPEGHYRNFRQTQQDFYRSLYKLGMDVKVYNIRKRPELSPVLKEYSTMLRDLNDSNQNALMKLSQLNIDINFLYSRTTDQRYISYYLVVNKRIENIKNFKTILQDILDKSFGTNIAFFNPHILDKQGVDLFLAEYFDVDAVNASGIHKASGFRDFNEFVDLVSVIDKDNREVPISLFDDLMNSHVTIASNKGIDDLVKETERERERWDARRQRSYDAKESKLMDDRRQDRITHQEYEERMAKLKEEHLPENFNELVEMSEEARARHLEQQELERQKELRRQERKRQKERDQDTRKWYEREDGLQTDKQIQTSKQPINNTNVQDDGLIEWDTLINDEELTLEDLMD